MAEDLTPSSRAFPRSYNVVSVVLPGIDALRVKEAFSGVDFQRVAVGPLSAVILAGVGVASEKLASVSADHALVIVIAVDHWKESGTSQMLMYVFSLLKYLKLRKNA